MNGNDTLFAFINQTTIYLFTVTDVNDTVNIVLQGTLPPEEEYRFSNMREPDGVYNYNFTWTPTTTQSVSIQFLVTDSAGAVTLLHPLVRLCACHQELDATCTDATGDAGDGNFLIQSCSCGPGDSEEQEVTIWFTSVMCVQAMVAHSVMWMLMAVMILTVSLVWNVLTILHL